MTFHIEGKWIFGDGIRVAEAIDEGWAHTIMTILNGHPAVIIACENARELLSGAGKDTPEHRIAKQCEAALIEARGGKP